MKLFRIEDVKGFFNAVASCKGTVELVTGDGDRLNLKSRLCQYFSIADIFSGDNDVPEIEIICSDPEDNSRLINFMMNEHNYED